MKLAAPINLETTGFSLPELLSAGINWPTTLAWDNKGLVRPIADFGTVFLGLDKVTKRSTLEWLDRIAVADGPVFIAPEKWHWCHVARALGFFKSANDARRNGWDGEFQPGWNEKFGRINKIRGSVVVFKVTESIEQ